jgi:hypothetical protein
LGDRHRGRFIVVFANVSSSQSLDVDTQRAIEVDGGGYS